MSPIDEDIRSANNTSLPVFRLPPEILADIFTRGARHYYETTERFDVGVVPDWVNVSYVCCYWRDVALNCSTLWTYHFAASVRWTEELLARSKQASLKIPVYFDSLEPSSKWLALMERLLLYVEQVQELRLHLPRRFNSSQIFLRAPRLRTLDIDGTWWHPPLGPAIECWDLPALRILKLYDCSLPWYSLNLSRLTTLSLCDVPPEFQRSVVDFLATLRCMQYLTVLHLEDALASAHDLLSSGTLELSPKLSLPCLARLCVIAPLSTVAALLSCINIPLKTEIEVEIGLESNMPLPSIEDYALIYSVLAQKFDHFKDLSLSGPTIPSLFIKFPRVFDASFMLYGDYNPYILGSPNWVDEDLPIMVRFPKEHFSIFTPANDRLDMLHSLPTPCPLTQVTTLHIVSPPFLYEFWRMTLGSLHTLRYLKLTHGPMPNLTSLLAEKQALVGWGTHRHTFVPELDTLELCLINFTFAQDSPEHGISQESLLDALAARKAPRPQLIMNWCGTYTALKGC